MIENYRFFSTLFSLSQWKFCFWHGAFDCALWYEKLLLNSTKAASYRWQFTTNFFLRAFSTFQCEFLIVCLHFFFVDIMGGEWYDDDTVSPLLSSIQPQDENFIEISIIKLLCLQTTKKRLKSRNCWVGKGVAALRVFSESWICVHLYDNHWLGRKIYSFTRMSNCFNWNSFFAVLSEHHLLFPSWTWNHRN